MVVAVAVLIRMLKATKIGTSNQSRIQGTCKNIFAIFVCSGVRHSGSNNAGEHTKMLNVLAREVAILSRFKLYRKFIPRGASACVDGVME